MVAADLRLSPTAIAAIVAALGLLLGDANGAAMAQAGAGLRGIAGITAAVFVAVTLASAGTAAW